MSLIIDRLISIYDAKVLKDREAGIRRAVGDFEDKSGFDRQIICRWRRKQNSGHIDSVTAIANALGYELVLRKIEEVAPA